MELLKRLYSISSPSGREKKMRKFIKRYVRDNIPEAMAEQDEFGNVFVTRGVADNYPCIACHIDEVCPDKGRFTTIEVDGKIFGWDMETMRQVGIGGDDKNGIWIALKLLEKKDCIKAAFFVGEEIGCQGSSGCDLAFFADCRYIIEADRRNGGDIITRGWHDRWASDAFMIELLPIAERFGYAETNGLTTDVDELNSRGVGVSCINISCGYYSPHTKSDYTVVAELNNALAFAEAIFDEMTMTYPNDGYNSEYYGYHDCADEYDDCALCMKDEYKFYKEEFDLDEFILYYSSYWPNLRMRDYKEIYEMIAY